ncbi:MAG: phage Gp37/Gp68 family protein [Boseongicola sp. SB0677_bin_26]|nr:phage Gp37/Gp68 family protein [Boseongicola sp. SB0665_bin_10]MYG25486.1 phage Gp37/Gp68 family protein [Boseongicola sp. SB0677_bin_26]
MAQKSDIEWTDATWNPVTGCTKVGPGCDNCYAERFAERWRGVAGHPYEQGFDLKLWPSRLEHPVHWRKPRMIFVNSMSDLFHKNIDRCFIDRVFDVMERADWHVFQVLTKCSSLMRNYVRARYGGRMAPRHIWLGVSVEDSEHVSRISHLKAINSEARFVSFEPLLGPIAEVDLREVAWAIVGGESGPEARPMRSEWVRNLRDVCQRDGVEFFFKQWGGSRPKSNGRLLDGVEWNGLPVHLLTKPLIESWAA